MGGKHLELGLYIIPQICTKATTFTHYNYLFYMP